ncbi:MAG TPA: DUF5916 domain-containing protein [Gemmatimonadales bacterium]|jgi:hypothetical protein|nr:DUF5916 domain-containing protein [Gemmatimonadales bacterium]
MSRLTVFLAVLCAPSLLFAQNIHPTPPPEVRAVPLTGSFKLDGRLDDPIWQTAPAATGLRQSRPLHQGDSAGLPATQRTEVRFVFDDAALYVGARMYDDSGAAGVRTRLARRDADVSSDYLQVIFDTYHDHIGRLFFWVNPSGVKQDANGLGGGGDPSWDPVWEVQTSVDSLGWTAEMRIPFSQLRYPSTSAEQTWGLQIWRQENRINELSQWAWWSQQETGGPPRFGHLHGLVIRHAPGRAEVMPYLVGRSSNIPGDRDDPFFDPHALDGRVGGDAMYRVTSNLTLNATVNPDFGQVEVDPAVVNLTAFETFFQEKRPFFVEGAGYFGLGGFSCFFCSNVSSLSMLATRRIGRPPQISPYRGGLPVPVAYADLPENSTILGAAKLTGRTPSGWSIGALDGITRRERAPVEFADSTRGRLTVEPLTNYFAGRVAKDLRGGAMQIKAMATSVFRDLDEPYIRSRLSHHAEGFGVSADDWWAKRTYRLNVQLAGTNVSGDTAALRRIRFGSAHFFQRRDRSDTTDALRPRTSMEGLGGYARLSKESGHILWELSTNFRTPAFNNNDIAFFSRADYWWMGGNIFPLWTKPTKWYRQLFVIAGGQQQYNSDGDLTDRQVQTFAQVQTLSYWWLTAFWIHRPSVFDDRLTRGGPVVRRPGINYFNVGVRSDSRKKISGDFNVDRGCNSQGDCDHSFNLSLRLQPRSNVAVSLGPSISHSETGFQYVGSYSDPTDVLFYGNRYLFAHLEQNALAMDTRLNVTFTPALTLELYLQPLIASGDFTRYSIFAAPRSARRLEYGRDFGIDSVIPAANPARDPATILLDADTLNGGSPTVSFTDPTFTFRSLRGNAVLRWEYRPGSTLFVVWTRSSRIPDLPRGSIQFSDDASALFQGPSENIFLVKMTYWLGF